MYKDKLLKIIEAIAECKKCAYRNDCREIDCVYYKNYQGYDKKIKTELTIILVEHE